MKKKLLFISVFVILSLLVIKILQYAVFVSNFSINDYQLKSIQCNESILEVSKKTKEEEIHVAFLNKILSTEPISYEKKRGKYGINLVYYLENNNGTCILRITYLENEQIVQIKISNGVNQFTTYYRLEASTFEQYYLTCLNQ